MLRIDHILVPTDFSEYSEKALAYGRDLAQLHDAELDLLHVLVEPSFPAFYKLGEEALYGEASNIEERCHQAMQALIDEAEGDQPKRDIGLHVQRGKPVGEIIEFAEGHSVDLIVISSHGMSAVEHALLGSVSEGVIKKAPCSVWVVR